MTPLELLYEAANAEIGVVVETDDPAALKQRLYAAKKDRPEFDHLSIWTSPIQPNDLWIGKSRPSDITLDEDL